MLPAERGKKEPLDWFSGETILPEPNLLGFYPTQEKGNTQPQCPPAILSHIKGGKTEKHC